MAEQINNEQSNFSEVVLGENEIICSLTNRVVKATDKELTLQSMINMMTEEYDFSTSDMERDFKVKYEDFDEGKTKNQKVDLAIFEEGRAHDVANLIRIIIVAKDAKVKPEDKKNGVTASLEGILGSTDCDFGCWTNGEDLQYQYSSEDAFGQTTIESISDFPAKGQTLEDLEAQGERAMPRKPANELFSSCEKYDDTALKGRIENVEQRVTDIETKLENLRSEVNSLSKLVKAFQDEVRIVSVTQLSDGTGYEISFTDGSKTTIKNGKDGEKPSISIEQDNVTGIWYWTIDGKRINVDGKDMPATMTPEIKVENGKFWFRVNGGEWMPIAGSDAGIGLIKDIKDGEESVTIILATGGEIVIPKIQSFRLNINISESGIFDGEMISIPYTIVAGDEHTKVAAYVGSGYTVSVAGDYTKGDIIITAPQIVPQQTSVIVIAVNGKGVSSSKILTLEQGILKMAKDTYTIGASGGNISIEVETNAINYNVNIDPDPKYSWLKSSPTVKALRKDILTLQADPYIDGTEPRTAPVQITYGNGQSKEVTITQLHTDISSGGKADFDTFATEPSRSKALITDNTKNGWIMTNGYLRKPTAVKPNAISKFPALNGTIESPGKLTSPEIDGGCGRLTVSMAGWVMPTFLTNGLKLKIEILQNNTISKTLYLDINNSDYQQQVPLERYLDINISGKFSVAITNACPSSNSSTDKYEDVYVTSVEWTGYSGQ